jgi:surface protein
VKKLIFVIFAVAGLLVAFGDSTAKAVWDANEKTLTFYYDENTYGGDGITQYDIAKAGTRTWGGANTATNVVFDESFKTFQPETCSEWFYGFSKLTSIINLNYLDTSMATSMSKMFSGLSSQVTGGIPRISQLDVSNFNTANVKDMSQMFGYMSLTSIDLSSFDTRKVTTFVNMFVNNKSLKTIWVSDYFVTTSADQTKSMFGSCGNLVGGAGTVFDANKATVTYARIDGGPGNPGYFTAKDLPAPPVITSVTCAGTSADSASVLVVGRNLAGGTITVQLLKDEELLATKVLTEFTSVLFEGLQTSVIYDVIVTAANAFGNAGPVYDSLMTYQPVSVATGENADEGLGKAGYFTVSRRDGDPVGAEITVNYTVGGTAVAGQTYAALPGSVVIPSGQVSAKVHVVPLDGAVTDGDTTLVLTLAQGGYTIAAGEATMTIVNGAAFGGWKYDSNAASITRGDWTFGATVSSGKLTVGKFTHVPASVQSLEFSRVVVDDAGASYTIVTLNPTFGLDDSSQPARVKGWPEAEFVGELTLPAEGLTGIQAKAFSGCSNLTNEVSFPSSLKTLGAHAFARSGLSGDIDLTGLTSIGLAALFGTSITSVEFGPDLTSIDCNYDRGCFQRCSSLTNVVFNPNCRIEQIKQFCFKYCSALAELDLSRVATLQDPTKIDNSAFGECTSLTKITFDILESMPPQALYAPALETVVFNGLPPTTFVTPDSANTRYLSPSSNGSSHSTAYDSKTIKTYVHKKFVNVTNGVGKCWADYAANGQIGAEKKNPANNTTWAADYVYAGIDLAKRPLLTIEPSMGLMILLR